MPPSELIPPMLAAAGPLPRGNEWAYEMKYDGSPDALSCLT